MTQVYSIPVSLPGKNYFETMPAAETLIETLNELRGEGYVEDFNLQQNCLECRNGRFKVFSDDFKVDKVFRFEGDSNPSDSSILYAISSDKNNVKGVLVNAYGIYSEPVTDEMVEKLEIKKQGIGKKPIRVE